MSTQLNQIATAESMLSELGQFNENWDATTYPTPFLRVGATCGYRAYFGNQYADTKSYAYQNADAVQLGRMSLPKPQAHSGEDPDPFTVTPGEDDPVGSIDPEVTPKRFYRMSWADENTASFIATGGDGDTDENDARNPLNFAPFGAFGNMNDTPVEATIAPGDTHVQISDLAWIPPAQYAITHAYFWASDLEEGPYRFVGKIAWNGSAWTDLVLFDTLASEAGVNSLLSRAANYNVWLATPTFTGMCNVNGRIVGIANGNKTRFNTETYGVYVKVTNGSRAIHLVDESGADLEDKHWPIFIENSGGILTVGNSAQRYEVDFIDNTDKFVAYLVTPYQEASTEQGTGDPFEMWGCNKLYICPKNIQQQEQCRPGFIFDGFLNFQSDLTAVFPEKNTGNVFVATSSAIYIITGLPGPESTQGLLEFTGRIEPVTTSNGVAGPRAWCETDMGLFVLSDTALILLTALQAQDVSSEPLRNFMRLLTFADKSRATLQYDYTRHKVLISLPNLLNEPRTPDAPASRYSTGFRGLDQAELLLEFDVDTRQFIVHNGGRWVTLVAAPAIGEGIGGEGSGCKVLFQDSSGDLQLWDEKRLVDSQGDTSEVVVAEVTEVVAGPPKVVMVDNRGMNLSRWIRTVALYVLTGENRGSFAYIIGRNAENTGWLVGDFFFGEPSPGDMVCVGAIQTYYQMGAIRPESQIRLGLTRVMPEMIVESTIEGPNPITDPVFSVAFEQVTDGVGNNLPSPQPPTIFALYKKEQVTNGRWCHLGRVTRSYRTAFGIDWIQTPMDEEAGVNQAAGRIVMLGFDLMTTEPEGVQQ